MGNKAGAAKGIKGVTAWPLRNDQIVLMRLSGMTQEDVAAQFGITRQQVSVIENDPRAKEIALKAKERLQEHLLETIDDQLDACSQLAIRSIKRTLEADISPVHKAKANQDRVAIKTLQGRGFLRVEDRGDGGRIQIPPAQFDKLLGALAKSDEARGIDPFAPKTVEGEFEVEDEPLRETGS